MTRIFRPQGRDILTAVSPKKLRRILLPVLILAAVALLVLLSSGSGHALRGDVPLPEGPRLQLTTPTPAPPEGSTAGSTDGIIWMGAAIAVIIFIPIVLKMSTLGKS